MTPFYAEAGGQIGDSGAFYDEEGDKLAEVVGTYAPVKGLERPSRPHASVRMVKQFGLHARVDPSKRRPTMRNHTATHLLHAALRDVLGQARQAGRQRRRAVPLALRLHALRSRGSRRD